MIIKLSAKLVEDVGKRKRTVTARTAEESLKSESKVTYDNKKPFKTEEGPTVTELSTGNVDGHPVTTDSVKRRQKIFSITINMGFENFDLWKLFSYKILSKTLQSYFGENNLKIRYMDTDSLVIGLSTDDLVTDLKNSLKTTCDMFDLSNLESHPELYDETKDKVFGKFKIEIPK